MKQSRYTHRNPDGKTYRVWMNRAGWLRIDQQGEEVFLFGELIDYLGRLEDAEERKKKERPPWG